MASRRAQIRQVFQSVPAEQLSGTSLDALYARCEANLAAVDVWATQGNQRALRQAGTGIVAICAWLASKSLADHPRQTAFQNQSGLSPAQFTASERELLPAVRKIITTSRSATSTPQKRRHGLADDDSGLDRDHANRTPTSSQSRGNADGGSSAASPADAVAQWVHNIKSGISPTKRPSASPLTPSHRRAARADAQSAQSMQPSTPSRSGLRDRSTIRSKTTFDPSPAAGSSPSKPKRAALSAASGSLNGSSSKRADAHRPAPSSAPLSTPLGCTPLSQSRTRGTNANWGKAYDSYPVPLGFRLDEPVRGQKWNMEEARERMQRVLDALKKGARTDDWQTNTPGVLETVELA